MSGIGLARGKSDRINEQTLKAAAEISKRQPRLAFYSPVASVILNYWKNLVPRYSISEELAKIVEKELELRWPNLSKRARRLVRRSR